MTLSPFPQFAIILLSLLAGAPASLASADWRNPSVPNAQAVAEWVGEQAPVQGVKWERQRAPGSQVDPGEHARRLSTLLDGWVQVPVERESGRPLTARAVRLPENWRHPRDFDSAWHLLRLDLGTAPRRETWLRLDAVAHACEVFVNGVKVGQHLGGFTPFEFEITAALQPGVNTFAVHVRDETAVLSLEERRAVSQLAATRIGGYTAPSGIRGGIYLEERDPVHVERVLIRASTRENSLRVTTWLRGAESAGVQVRHEIREWPRGESVVLSLPSTSVRGPNGAVEIEVPWTDAKRWSPDAPNLYTLRTTVESGGRTESFETRFGFREFWIEGKNFMLNGVPTRLLGASGAKDLTHALVPEVGRIYGRAVLDFLKREFNFRTLRYHATLFPREAILAADEAGVMVINQSAIWSAMAPYYTNAAAEFMANTERQFSAWFWRDANSPSVVIWDVENEMIRDQRGEERKQWVLALDDFIKRWDAGRVVQHSGAAWYAPGQEVVHVHMQEQYNAVLRDWRERDDPPLVIGEFWVGGRGGETRLSNGHEYADRLDWFQEESRLYREKTIEMRNFGASGVMPFWLERVSLGRVHDDIWYEFEPSRDAIFRWPYPGLRNLGGEALAPAIAFVWPRGASVERGGDLEREVVLCNDRLETASFTIEVRFGSRSERWPVTAAPGEQVRKTVRWPAVDAAGPLEVKLTDATGAVLFDDRVDVSVIEPEPSTPAATHQRRVLVVPTPEGAVASALRTLGLEFEPMVRLPDDASGTLVVVPPGVDRRALGNNGRRVQEYLARGGRLLVLRQDVAPVWLPFNLPFWPSSKPSAPEFAMLGWPDHTRNLMFMQSVPLQAPGHPVFSGLQANDLYWWNPDDGRVADDVFVRPGVLELQAGAPYRVLAGASRRENASIVEARIGAGTAIFCQLQLTENPSHPAARRLLSNLLDYLDGAAWATAPQKQVGLAGQLSDQLVSTLTGLERDLLVAVTQVPDAPDLVLAGDGADIDLLRGLAETGRTVMVLSHETAGRLPGYRVSSDPDRHYAGTRGGAADLPLFWGIATASFMPVLDSPARGVLVEKPAHAETVLRGLTHPSVKRARPLVLQGFRNLETFTREGDLAVVEAIGSGRLVVTTIEPWTVGKESHRQFLSTVLANAGVPLPWQAPRGGTVQVKRTPPLLLDGRLDDWTNAMEDRNVSLFQHADPIVLAAHDAIAGQVSRDIEQSAVVYLLYDDKHLYVGGIVFPAQDPGWLELSINHDRIRIGPGERQLSINGAVTPAPLATGRLAARDVVDTRLLSLTRFNPQIVAFQPAPDTPGQTFEVAIPWTELGSDPTAGQWQAVVRQVRPQGATLQQPGPDSPDRQLVLRRADR